MKAFLIGFLVAVVFTASGCAANKVLVKKCKPLGAGRLLL
jgi:hypothetical protein